MARGYDRPLYIQPFDHRGSLQSGLLGWTPPFSAARTAEIANAVGRIAARYRSFVDLFKQSSKEG
jgi:hypothetical protein